MLQTDFIKASDTDSKFLMVVLHGLGDSMEGYRFLPEVLGLPWMNYLLVNAPDPYFTGYQWYSIPGEDQEKEIERSRKMLFELLDHQRSQGWPTEKTFLFGFSYRFAGIVGISGYLFHPEQLLKEQSPVAKDQHFLITHGTYDPLIPISETKKGYDFASRQGLQIDWVEFPKDHTIQGEAELKVIHEFLCRQALDK